MEETLEQPQVEAPEPAAPSAVESAPVQGADDFAGFNDEQKKRVSEIVSKRLNDVNKKWERFGKPEDLESRLTNAQKLEQHFEQMRQQFAAPGAVPGQNSQAPLTEEDKKVLAYMERLMPGFSKIQETMKGFQSHAQQQEVFRWKQISDTNENQLRSMAKESGYKEEHFAELSNRVAQSIMGNREDYAAYLQNNGNFEIVKKHFSNLDKFLKGFAPLSPAAQTASYVQTKAKTANLPPRMPAAGVPAATSAKKKLSEKERVDAAFARFQEGSAG